MKALALAALLAASVAAHAAPIDTAIDACRQAAASKDDSLAGYCIGVMHTTYSLWPTTYMSKGKALCHKNTMDQEVAAVVKKLEAMKKAQAALSSGQADPKANVLALGELPPNWERAGPHDLIFWAYAQEMKCS